VRRFFLKVRYTITMLLFIHISVALLGLLQAGWAALSPSRKKINSTNALTAATVTSGAALVWTTHSPLTQACGTGFAYLAVIMSIAWVAGHRLAVRNES
jgi:hypothetical protein